MEPSFDCHLEVRVERKPSMAGGFSHEQLRYALTGGFTQGGMVSLVEPGLRDAQGPHQPLEAAQMVLASVPTQVLPGILERLHHRSGPNLGSKHQGVELEQQPALFTAQLPTCLLYTSDAADEEDSVDLGGRRSIKKKKV
eukprot:TRINITY_DN56920_c0_g1_i1.p2 TRINITY_DN56920_c0_g1~~TRINITY_DN56920_c0_g1_i1.p2  ORF type:complete len:140 (+),score=32.25 TRINITY_DN56920_c0_g1_i1:440-859(+)